LLSSFDTSFKFEFVKLFETGIAQVMFFNVFTILFSVSLPSSLVHTVIPTCMVSFYALYAQAHCTTCCTLTTLFTALHITVLHAMHTALDKLHTVRCQFSTGCPTYPHFARPVPPPPPPPPPRPNLSAVAFLLTVIGDANVVLNVYATGGAGDPTEHNSVGSHYR